MIPGETFIGYDLGNHLWVALSLPTERGEIALVNLTTHGRSSRCGDHCIVVRPGEHPFVRRESCVHYQKAVLGLVAPLDAARERRTLAVREPISAELLLRAQEGALASRLTKPAFKAVVRATLERGAASGYRPPPAFATMRPMNVLRRAWNATAGRLSWSEIAALALWLAVTGFMLAVAINAAINEL